MLIKTYGGAVHGIDAMIITAEVNVSGGNSYSIVGLPDNAVRESYKRIDAAFRNRGLHMPRRGILVNLAPADIRTEGASYDLGIAAGIRSEEHTSELQSIMRISYTGSCLKKKTKHQDNKIIM